MPKRCRNFTNPSLKLDAKYCDKCHFRHVELEEKPSKKSKNGRAKGSVALLKESIQLNCVSQDLHPKKPTLRKEGEIGNRPYGKIIPEHVAPHQNSGKKGSIARNHPKV